MWTGTKMLVWGGFNPAVKHGPAVGDGAAYDPKRRSWRKLPASPLAPMIGPVGVWTGTEMLVFGDPATNGQIPSTNPGAAYDPSTNRWRRLARFRYGSLIDSGSYAVWTGTKMLVWGFFESGPGTDHRAAMLNPTTDTWTLTRPAPVEAPIFGHAFWTGHKMLVYGATGARLISGKNTERTIAVSYNPTTNTWRTLPRAPLPGVGYDALAAWTGHELIIGGGDSHADAAAYNPTTNRWRRLPAAPEDFTGNEGADSYPNVWTGRQVVTFDDGDPHGRPLLLDPTTGTWTIGAAAPIPGRTDAPVIWTGTEALLFGGGTTYQTGPATGGCCRAVKRGEAYHPSTPGPRR